jgi:DNA mismatch repair protein MutS2
LRESEQKEITRILGELTREVRDHRQPILSSLRAAGVLDLIAAKCRYAKKRGCICPEVDEGGALILHEARHPLLVELFAEETGGEGQAREVMPIDVRLGDDFDVLVVTGPNTGGKTVALKTVGLLALMTQCGIPIPVGEGSKMPVFKQVFIDVGDEQSLQQSLSTFSSHLQTLLEILGGSGPQSLVLIDEMGAGTDPDEGAAIGRAVVTELLQLGVRAIVTTHLSALKAIAFTTPRVDNAAVEFDPQTLRPTYRLLLGEPGNSNAMIIATRLGMPARLVKMAKGYLDDRTGALNKAIAGTLSSRREAEEARRQAREAELQAQNCKQQFEQEHAELRESKEAFSRWTQWISDLKPGDDVHLRTLDRAAKVVRVQLHQQKALVSAGAIDIEVSIQDIEAPHDGD